MDINGTWELFDSRFPQNNLATLTINLKTKSGSLRYLQQDAALTSIAQTGPSSFRANYAVSRFHGVLDAQLNSDGSLDVKFTGTPAARLRGRSISQLSDSSTPSPNVVYLGRSFTGHLVTPRSVRGDVARGTLHLWSGETAKEEALLSLKKNPPGWMMGNINGEPAPGHAEAKVLFASAKTSAIDRARLRGLTLTPGKELAQEEFEAIWGRPSGDLVYRATLAGMPVHSHGRPGPLTIQARYELPALRKGGFVSGGLSMASGFSTLLSTADDSDRPVLAAGKALTGTTELTGGIMYASGALAEVPEAMAMGGGLARLGGGAGQVFISSYSLVVDIRNDQKDDAVADSLGVVSGVLLLVAPFTGPAAPVLLAISFALAASQLTFKLSKRYDSGPQGTSIGDMPWNTPRSQREWWDMRPQDLLDLNSWTLSNRCLRDLRARDHKSFENPPRGWGR